MFYIPKIGAYSKILADDELKDFVVINFAEYFKPMNEKLYSKVSEEQHLLKSAESLFMFLTTTSEVKNYVEMMQLSFSDNCLYHFNIKILNLFDLELHLINTKPIIKKN